MVDFTQRAASVATVAVSDVLSALLDAAIAAKSKADYAAGRGSGVGEVAAKRIGAGYIGVECAAELAFRFHKYPKEDRPSVVSKGELQRHAESGHWTEARTAEWLRLAGVLVRTDTGRLNTFGKPEQIGWKAARNPETGQYRMAGEVDGIIDGFTAPEFSDPEILALLAPMLDQLRPLIKPPCIWESKKGTNKKWTKFSREGVKKADPKYYGQVQTNMAYLNAEQTLFSMLNLDNMKYHWELIPFVQADAQRLSDRAVTVMESNSPFELPKACRSVDDFKGMFCDFHDQCQCGLVLKEPEEPLRGSTAEQSAQREVPGIKSVQSAPRRVFNPNFKVS